jgi:hypothetical protein
MVINIHIDGDVLLNLERLVINNDYLSCGGPEKAANNQHDGRAKETRDVANNEEGSEGLSDDANDSLPSHEYDAVDEIRGAASSDGGDIDDSDMDPCDTPLSPGSSIASPNPGNQFKCRLHNCDLGFINNQQREDHELWAHFLCGRCGAEYASLYLADEVCHRSLCLGPARTNRPDCSTGKYTYRRIII